MKQELLEALADTRRREADLAALCTAEPPDPDGRWRAQDHLAHIAWLRDRDAQIIEAVRTGGEIPPHFEGDLSAEIYSATRDHTAATVIANAERSWDQILSAIGACAKEDLERPHPHRQDRKLIDGSPGDHLGAHLMWCYLEAGDDEAAEAVQLWARDLSNRLSDDPRSRGLASYNLGCFYARVGRVDDAVTLLREGFEGAPYLKEWAERDPDLDPIRESPELKELLAT